MAKIKSKELIKTFDSAFTAFHTEFRRNQDPVSMVHLYKDSQDQEVVAFISALLAYGNVTTILSSIKKVIAPLGFSPYMTLLNQPVPKYPDFKHRFTTGEDIEVLLYWIKTMIQLHGSIENFLLNSTHRNTGSVKLLLSDFVQRIFKLSLPERLIKIKDRRERNLKYLVSDPARGSACKRLNLFLRWMVREKDGIDLGLWKGLQQKDLMLPVDTHLLQTLRKLGWTRSKNATWKVVEQATKRLRTLYPEDPIKYDFALCHLSMSGNKLVRHQNA